MPRSSADPAVPYAGEVPLAVQVGEVLRELRGDEQRAAAARKLGIPRPNLIMLEEGRANPTLDRLAGIAAGYGYRLRVVAEPLTRPGG
jgi:transcriptional regulator with XRE-family HTH domain